MFFVQQFEEKNRRFYGIETPHTITLSDVCGVVSSKSLHLPAQ